MNDREKLWQRGAGMDFSTKTKPQTDAQHAADAAARQFTMADYSSAQELTKKKN